MDSIKKGDVVKLKSGGPYMTVQSVGMNEVSCKWFDDLEVKQAHFCPESLKIIEKESTPAK
jgi:uncharacterized protein YodC (DUF2158 family)